MVFIFDEHRRQTVFFDTRESIQLGIQLVFNWYSTGIQLVFNWHATEQCVRKHATAHSSTLSAQPL